MMVQSIMNRKDVVSIRLCLCREIPKNVENVEKKCEKSVDVKWMKQIFRKDLGDNSSFTIALKPT